MTRISKPLAELKILYPNYTSADKNKLKKVNGILSQKVGWAVIDHTNDYSWRISQFARGVLRMCGFLAVFPFFMPKYRKICVRSFERSWTGLKKISLYIPFIQGSQNSSTEYSTSEKTIKDGSKSEKEKEKPIGTSSDSKSCADCDSEPIGAAKDSRSHSEEDLNIEKEKTDSKSRSLELSDVDELEKKESIHLETLTEQVNILRKFNETWILKQPNPELKDILRNVYNKLDKNFDCEIIKEINGLLKDNAIADEDKIQKINEIEQKI